MLASDADLSRLRFPLVASPKLDGIRALISGSDVLSRSLKLIPNLNIQDTLGHKILDGFDGELIVGEPTSKSVYRDTVSVVMSDEKPADTCTFYVFDVFTLAQFEYKTRRKALEQRAEKVAKAFPRVKLWYEEWIENIDDLLDYETDILNEGYEGLILRDANSPYKFGRSTTKEGIMLKLKRFTDDEAKIIGFEEQMHNTNEAKTNELGRTKRSSAKAGLVGKGTLGALVCRDLKSGVEFNIGTGMTDGEKQWIWTNRAKFKGAIVKYKSFKIGVKDAPRHPVFLGFRDRRDM